jgi:hypothetical protein
MKVVPQADGRCAPYPLHPSPPQSHTTGLVCTQAQPVTPPTNPPTHPTDTMGEGQQVGGGSALRQDCCDCAPLMTLLPLSNRSKLTTIQSQSHLSLVCIAFALSLSLLTTEVRFRSREFLATTGLNFRNGEMASATSARARSYWGGRRGHGRVRSIDPRGIGIALFSVTAFRFVPGCVCTCVCVCVCRTLVTFATTTLVVTLLQPHQCLIDPPIWPLVAGSR